MLLKIAVTFPFIARDALEIAVTFPFIARDALEIAVTFPFIARDALEIAVTFPFIARALAASEIPIRSTFAYFQSSSGNSPSL